jgi:prephenate dehydrogenase
VRAAVIGTGLIGTSTALGLSDLGWEVVGWDPDHIALEEALEMGAVRVVASSAEQASDRADLVVLAGPPAAIVDHLALLRTDALVTDVAGVKRPVVAAGAHLDRFVGGHPMAGREHAGPGAASAGLFRGSAWVLCDDGAHPADIAELSDLVSSLGARPVVMSAERHDRAVAVISHLPQLLAAALIESLEGEPEAMDLASGSFRDLTRVALSEPGWSSEVLLENRTEVERALGELVTSLGGWSLDLSAEEPAAVFQRLERARDGRRRLAPPIVLVEVLLRDEPGELAAVGRALATSRVDVRDLQLRHAPHGGGGVLAVSVRPGEAGALRRALFDEGFSLVE